MFTGPKSAGFTKVELLAVIVIIGALLTLLLPALQRGCIMSRVSICINNLKQIGLGLHNHHDVKKALPLLSTAPTVIGQSPGPFPQMYQTPGSYDADDPEQSAGYSWIVKILPFIEETVLYHQISRASNKFSIAAFAPQMTPASYFTEDGAPVFSNPKAGNPHFSQIQVAPLRCPSYEGQAYSSTVYATKGTFTGYVDASGNAVNGAAVCNYAAMTATHLGCMTTNAEPDRLPSPGLISIEPPNGMLIPSTVATPIEKLGINFRNITDGLAYTIMVAETREPNYSAWYDGTVNWLVAANPGTAATNGSRVSNSGAVALRYMACPTTADDCYWHVGPQTTPLSGPPANGGRSSLNVGDKPNVSWAYMDSSTSIVTNGVSGPPSYIDGKKSNWVWGPSSFHAGGVILHLYGDGSVKSITDDIDATVYAQLVTRAGNEPSAPFY